MPDLVLIWGAALVLTALFAVPFLRAMRRREREAETAGEEALRYGLSEPATLHPVVDPGRCIGIGNCVRVCPEHVLVLEHGQAAAVRAARCIGHGLCERVCPVDAIQLVFGTATRGVELPRVKGNFETNVRGLYVVGELGGMGLVANAVEQGRQCVEGILREPESGPEGVDPLLIVGCGPAGLSAALTALDAGIRPRVLEKEGPGGAVRHYPRKKMVMTRPVVIPGYGRLPLREIRKEDLIDLWEEIVRTAGLLVSGGVTVAGVEAAGPLHFRVRSTAGGVFEAQRVVLAIGRRGVPRKLGVPGEEAPHVQYALREPESFRDEEILVVGGGDSAVEAALALAEQPGNRVRISYRRDAFGRIRPENLARVEEALRTGRVEVLWRTRPTVIEPGAVRLAGTGPSEDVEERRVPGDQVFIFAGGELPTPFLRACGVEIDTKFGEP
ncbi:MAG TPA: NAD(P)-binding domain-containing protein [Longimicrobiales bacterium]|nr:NAD(P)-binding domain-containing protein [Longimicrobiales bacterium]